MLILSTSSIVYNQLIIIIKLTMLSNALLVFFVVISFDYAV
jgi:hypothetical protein